MNAMNYFKLSTLSLSIAYIILLCFTCCPGFKCQEIWSNEKIKNLLATSKFSGKKDPFGIVYIVYCHPSLSRNLCALYYKLASNSADTFRYHSPNLPTALIGSKNILEVSSGGSFTKTVAIPDELLYPGKQWLTRLLALNLSPFEITLEVDSDSVACGDISSILRSAYDYRFGPVTFSVMKASNDPADLYPQNGVLLYNSSSVCFRAIRKKWLRNQNIFQNTTRQYDDQRILGEVLSESKAKQKLMSKHGCEFHWLSPVFNTVLGWRAPKVNGSLGWYQNWYWTTRPISSKVHIIHANGAYTFADKICGLVNQDESRPRILTYLNEGPPRYPNMYLRFESYRVAYSMQECRAHLHGNCDTTTVFAQSSSATPHPLYDTSFDIS